MTVNYIVEPNYSKTVWFRETLTGIDARCSALRYRLNAIGAYGIVSELGTLMIIGTSPSWVSEILELCRKLGIVTVVVSCHSSCDDAPSSHVIIDHDGATRECIDYLRSCGRSRLAICGVNSDSYADTIKIRHFAVSDVYYLGDERNLICAVRDRAAYDAVVCTNYISAVYLLGELKTANISVPDDVYLICYGDSVLGNRLRPSISNITLDHERLGEQAVRLYRSVVKIADSSSVTVSVPCKIVPAESTENKPYIRSEFIRSRRESVNFPLREEEADIQRLEKLLRETDPTDIEIIRAMLSKRPLARIVEELYISESAVKYRIKRMLGAGEFESTDRMLTVYARYLD